ncbi:unnamed protein product [Cochlearia groenlandica]
MSPLHYGGVSSAGFGHPFSLLQSSLSCLIYCREFEEEKLCLLSDGLDRKMKLNINKACDLKSISVFPPNLRRRSSVEPQSSQQQQQLRYSQHSQQSFSQVPSPQRSCFSQMTQSSGEELILNDQRFGSQDRDITLKKNSFLPPINHNKRDDTQMVASRSSSGLTSRWSSASLGDSKSQISEELEQRFGMMETSLSKFGMMLDSIQTDIMQTNRGTNEVFLENKASGRSVKACVYPKTQVGCWKTVKPDKSTANVARKKVKPRTQIEQGSIVIESDEDIDGGFSCLLNGNTKGANIEWDAEKETDRLMKTARRKKRKFGNPIIITD